MNPKSHGTARPTVVLMALLATALTSGCGISKAQYLDLTHRHDDLATKNQQLQASLASANNEKTQLEASKTQLESRVRELESESAERQRTSDDAKSTYETLIGKLQGELSSGKVEIQRMRDGLSVNLAQDILFRSGSSELDAQGRELLLKVAEELKPAPFDIFVNGHTDNQKIGAALATRYPTNWELGAARSSRIVRLFQEAGLSKERLTVVSHSDSRPRESNDTPEGRAKNRRIEIRLRPATNDQTATEPGEAR